VLDATSHVLVFQAVALEQDYDRPHPRPVSNQLKLLRLRAQEWARVKKGY
jgi:hypothetical protein